ncbi:hypothetical protein MJI47_29935, partial [Salmonella enterica subsp. enterica serovar Kentucky]|nr:hypothetical protein [Salmonella enterica subsp. enterica serovar Kentucky]
MIGLTTSIAFSVQAANIDEYIKQLPAGANLALMVQKIGAPAPCRPGLISAAPSGNVSLGWHLATIVFSNYPVFLFFFPSPVHPL